MYEEGNECTDKDIFGWPKSEFFHNSLCKNLNNFLADKIDGSGFLDMKPLFILKCYHQDSH